MHVICIIFPKYSVSWQNFVFIFFSFSEPNKNMWLTNWVCKPFITEYDLYVIFLSSLLNTGYYQFFISAYLIDDTLHFSVWFTFLQLIDVKHFFMLASHSFTERVNYLRYFLKAKKIHVQTILYKMTQFWFTMFYVCVAIGLSTYA